MVDDLVGCLTGEPVSEDEFLLWEQEQLRVLQQYEEALLNPF